MTRPAIHPGEILADELEELDVSPTELARQINVPANRISQIINGKRAITGDTALRLGHWFGNSAQFWLNLQSSYDLRLAEQEAGAEIETLPVRPAQRSQSQQPGVSEGGGIIFGRSEGASSSVQFNRQGFVRLPDITRRCVWR